MGIPERGEKKGGGEKLYFHFLARRPKGKKKREGDRGVTPPKNSKERKKRKRDVPC